VRQITERRIHFVAISGLQCSVGAHSGDFMPMCGPVFWFGEFIEPAERADEALVALLVERVRLDGFPVIARTPAKTTAIEGQRSGEIFLLETLHMGAYRPVFR